LAYHPFKDQLAVALPARARIYDLEGGTCLWDTPQSFDLWPTIAWHPGGRLLAMVEKDWVISLWDISHYKKVMHLEGHANAGIHVVFDHTGDLLATRGWEGVLRLWDTRSGESLYSTPLKNEVVFQFNPDNRLIAMERDGKKLRVWEVTLSTVYKRIGRVSFRGLTAWMDTCVSPSGSFVGVGTPQGFGFFDIKTGRDLGFFKSPEYVHVLFDEQSGDLITNSPSGARRWQIGADPSVPGLLRLGPSEPLGLPGSFWQPACSLDGRTIVSPQRTEAAVVLHRDRPAELVRLSPHEDVRHVAISPDGRFVATASHDSSHWIRVWDAHTGRPLKDLDAGYASSQVAISPDGRWIAAGGDAVHLWDVTSWREVARFGSGGRVPVAFSPDSRILAFESGLGVIGLADVETRREIIRLEHPEQAEAKALAFAPGGSAIVASSTDSQTIFAWDLKAIGQELEALHLTSDIPGAHALTPGAPSYTALVMAGDRVPDEPSEDIVLEAENLETAARLKAPAGAQIMTPFPAHRWSNDRQLYCACEEGGHVDVSIKWPGSGKYELWIAFTQAGDYGIVETAVDGKKVGDRFDGYASDVRPGPLVRMGTVLLAPGSHILRFTVVGKSSLSRGYYLGIDYVVFKAGK
jgi:WD40 repeat protein